MTVNYRSTPEIVAFTNASIGHNVSGFAKTLESARPPGMRPVVVPAADAYEEAEFLCQQILECHEQGIGLNRMAVLYRNHHDSILLAGRAGRAGDQLHGPQRPAVLRAGAHQGRAGVPPGRGQSARRVRLATAAAAPAGDRPGQGRGDLREAGASRRPARRAGHGRDDGRRAEPRAGGCSPGFVADLRAILATRPESNPAAAVAAVLKGGYPATVRSKYERPDNRIADIEQLAILAARYDSLERLIAELLLAGDVYGMDTLAGDEPGEALVLSTIHQAKGLEWSRVFIPRLIEDSFPGARALNEPGGEEEERRVFYVAVIAGDGRALPDLPADGLPRRLRPDDPHDPEPVPDRDRQQPLRARGPGDRPRPRPRRVEPHPDPEPRGRASGGMMRHGLALPRSTAPSLAFDDPRGATSMHSATIPSGPIADVPRSWTC